MGQTLEPGSLGFNPKVYYLLALHLLCVTSACFLKLKQNEILTVAMRVKWVNLDKALGTMPTTQ